jgi:hypothetical protein
MRSLALREDAPIEALASDQAAPENEEARRRRLRIHERRIERAVEMVATRFVRTWGFTTVSMVAQRFRLTTTGRAPRSVMARRALSGLRDLRWLDEEHEWFTLLDSDSPTSIAFAKIVAVLGTVDRQDLLLALGKRHSFGDAPERVVRAYLDELVSRHQWARAWSARTSSASAPTREERMVVECLRDAGGTAEIAVLRRAAEHNSISPDALIRTLSRSPLFVRVARGTFALVSHAPVGYTFGLVPRPQRFGQLAGAP